MTGKFTEKDYVDRKDLQELADGMSVVEGSGIVRLGKKVIITRPQLPLRIKARVWLVPDDGYGSAGGGVVDANDRCPGRRAYAFQQVRPAPCGDYDDDDVAGIYGDGDATVAFETDNLRVRDDSVQTLEPHIVWRDELIEPGLFVEEWMFQGTVGSVLPSSAGGTKTGGSNASGDDTSPCGGGVPTKICYDDGTEADGCMSVMGGILVVTDTEGNIVFGG